MVTVRRSLLITLLLIILLALPACSGRQQQQQVPAANSQFVGQFVHQEDGDLACALLRPAGWSAAASSGARIYAPPRPPEGGTVMLSVVNYRILGENAQAASAEGGVTFAEWEAFRENPTLAGWTQAMEQSWQANPILAIERLESLDQTVIYTVSPASGSGQLSLSAFVVAGDEPLALLLTATGDLADVSRLRQEGLYDDLVTMAKSVTVIPEQPGYSKPPLPEGTNPLPR